MGAATLHVLRSVANKPILLAPLHQLKAVKVVGYSILGQPLHKNAVDF